MNYEHGSYVQQNNDGGYRLVGHKKNSDMDKDVYLIKTDEYGLEQWSQTFGGDNLDDGFVVKQTNDGGYIITGGTESYVSNITGDHSNIYLIKTDENGETQWIESIGGEGRDVGYSIEQTSDQGYIITGQSNIDGSGTHDDVYLVKTDEYGQVQWEERFGWFGMDIGFSVQQTTDEGFIITGYTSVNESPDVYIIKTNEYGQELWSHVYDGLGYSNFGHQILQTNDGGYIVLGVDHVPGQNEDLMYLIKIDEDGLEEWSQVIYEMTFSGSGFLGGGGIQQTNDGGYILVGTTELEDGGNRDVVVVKTNEFGVKLWDQTFGGIENDYGQFIIQNQDGEYVFIGTTNSFDVLNSGIYLTKMVLPTLYNSVELTSCDSVQNIVNNNYIHQSGLFIDTLINQFGGDSITQNIIINESPENTLINGNINVTPSTRILSNNNDNRK